MKNLIAPVSFSVILITGVFTLLFFNSNKGGAPDGRSSSPGDGGSTCTACHGGSALNMASLITTDIPVTGYVPGQTYNITISGDDGRTRYGFQMASEMAGGAKVGSFTPTTETNLLSSGNITHDNTSIDFTGTVGSWVVQWTAPSAGTGDVTFYSSFLAADGNGGTSGGGDQVFKGSTTVTEGIPSDINDHAQGLRISTYPNPATDRLVVNSNSIVASAKIVDMSGKIWKVETGLGGKSVQFNILNLPTGYYTIIVTDENVNTTSQKVLKM